jgi:hypothetical protein
LAYDCLHACLSLQRWAHARWATYSDKQEFAKWNNKRRHCAINAYTLLREAQMGLGAMLLYFLTVLRFCLLVCRLMYYPQNQIITVPWNKPCLLCLSLRACILHSAYYQRGSTEECLKMCIQKAATHSHFIQSAPF